MDQIHTENKEILTKLNKLSVRESKLNKLLWFNFKNKTGTILLISFALVIECGFIYVLTEKPVIIGPNFRIIYSITDKLRMQSGDNITNTQKLVNLDYQYWIESILVVFPILIGMLGLYMLKLAPSYHEDKSKTNTIMYLGIIFIVLGIFFLITLYGFKLNARFGDYDIFF